MSLATEKKLDHLHWPLVLCTIVICTLGVLNLASATKNALNPMWIAQSKWMFLGAVAVGAFLFLDYRFLSTAAWPGYFAALALLAGVAFRGKKVLGARRWLQLGPMQLQPSEFVKLALIVVLARYFSKDDVGARKGQYGLVDLWQPFLFVLVPVALIMKQPDLGTAIVTFAIAMTMIVFAKVRWQSLTVLFAGGIASAVFAWQRLLKPYQKSRILTFLDPQAYAKGAGYHAIQSVIAVGSGQWSGKGWGDGTQNQLSFLPEQHTDFIFSVWAEEHGFLGGVLLVSLYGFLVLTALDVAANARDKFGSFLAIGIASLFFWHAFINIGMVTGMLPVVGVPLPLFSYGGSSVLADLLGIGILLNVSLRRFMF
jgi:rod shape determining protein RodA